MRHQGLGKVDERDNISTLFAAFLAHVTTRNIASATDFFDIYVTSVFPNRKREAGADWAWPGDEWVSDEVREATYDRLTAGMKLDQCCRVVEIGPGSGKYTEMLLARSRVSITACELSAEFIASLRQRCAAAVTEGRLIVHQSDWADNRGLLKLTAVEASSLDLFFGIDVFLMIDFQSMLAYLVSAATILREGGRFFGTFGDGTSESGWRRMLRDLGRHSGFDDAPSTRFHWTSPEAIRFALEQLGFTDVVIERGPGPGAELDIARLYVSATLAFPMPLEDALALLTPTGDSTNIPDMRITAGV